MESSRKKKVTAAVQFQAAVNPPSSRRRLPTKQTFIFDLFYSVASHIAQNMGKGRGKKQQLERRQEGKTPGLKAKIGAEIIPGNYGP